MWKAPERSPDECANLKVLVDDAVFDFENRQGAQLHNPQAPDSKFSSELIRHEVTGSVAPFKGCQLLAMSTPRESTGDACTRHSYQWRLNLVPPKLDVIVKIESDIPDAGALVGRLKNEFDSDASIVRRGP